MTSRRSGFVPVALALMLLAAVAGVAVASVVTPRGALRPKLRLGCENTDANPQLLVKPARCLVNDPTMTFARSVDLHKLHWTKWSASGATATGVECGFRARCDNTRVRVTLSGLKRVMCAKYDYRVFTKLKSTSSTGTTRVPPVTCPKGEG